MATHPSTLAWKIPWMEEPGRLQSMESLRVGHNWATSFSLFIFMHWRRKWQPTPVFLPGESQGRRSLVGCRLWGLTESVTMEAIQQQQQQQQIISGYLKSSVQFSSVAQSRPTPCDPMNRSTPGLPVYHQLPEFTQTHVHRVGDVIQPSHPLLSLSSPAPNPSQHQGLFQWDNSKKWEVYKCQCEIC